MEDGFNSIQIIVQQCMVFCREVPHSAVFSGTPSERFSELSITTFRSIIA
ncbi:hypothetical protein SAMN05444273_10783 [Litoreibacter ascidiaceicola]|uniref:Uncharacterized protein n=1 Tax=Litoreibacter ascidiaceicola TaxID=1486859 RepID=A0A1M5CDU7_9RHOB|nr:hypothetical protein SAMN05444273_10783 [Litoreibacter ascidiaceicola]